MIEFNCMIPASQKAGHRLHISKSDGLDDKEVTVVIGNMSTIVSLADLHFGVRSIYEACGQAADQRVRQQHDNGGGYRRPGYQGNNYKPKFHDQEHGDSDRH